MANKLFLPFLTDDQGRSLDLENSVVATKSIPDPLEHSPEGWESNTIEFSRNTEFRGVIKAYITNLKFYLEAATILRNAFYRFGMETVLYFIWLKQNRTFGAGMKYESWYKGEPDFGTFKDEYDGVEINITEGGYYKDLQANKSIVQTIDFDDDLVKIYMDGTNIAQNVKYIVTNGGLASNYGQHTIDIPLVSSEATSQVNANSVERRHFTDNADLIANSNPFLTTGATAQAINIKLHFGVQVHLATGETPNPTAGARVLIRAFDESGTATDAYDLADIGGSNDLYDQHKTIDVNTTITVPANRRIYLLMFLTIGGTIASGSAADEVVSWTYDGADADVFQLNYFFKYRGTLINGFRAIDFGKKINSKVSTGSNMTSPILDNDYNLMVASGDSIRGLPGAQIKSNLSDWFTSVDAVKCLSFRVTDNNPVIVDRYADFDRSKTIGSLGECSNWTLEPADDYIYDTVESGYKTKSSQSTDDINGIYSFNEAWNWKINVTRRKSKKYSCRSVYYGDPYDIELIRLNLDNKDTTSASTDNDVFFIDCIKSIHSFTGDVNFLTDDNSIELVGDVAAYLVFMQPGTKFSLQNDISLTNYTIVSVVTSSPGQVKIIVKEYIAGSGTVAGMTAKTLNTYDLRRLPYTSITGVPDQTVFNIEISQKRNLMNHYRWLRSSFDHLDANKVIFTSTDKNDALVTTDASGNVINEKEDILVMNMGAKVYLPYLVKFNVKSPENLLNLMADNVGGKFDYLRDSLNMEGYPIDVKTDDSELTTQEYDLLLTDNNDLLKLILR